MSLDVIDPFPWFLHKDIPLKFGGGEGIMHLRASEWTDHWRCLLGMIVDCQKLQPRRMMVAIVGTPGSAKSYFAAQLAWLAEHDFIPGSRGIALPMDGFHYPNRVLGERNLTLATGEKIPLRECRGAPETFDAAALRQRLVEIRRIPEEITWPDYNPRTHDPAPGSIRISSRYNLILVEGSYLLLDVEPYDGIAGLFDLRIYLEAPAATVLANLVNRRMENGKTLVQAKEWVKRVDLPNARLAEATQARADVIIARDRRDILSAVAWRTGANSARGPVAGKPTMAMAEN